MGCVNSKCCSRYPSSSDGDSYAELGGNNSIPRKSKFSERSIDVVPVPSHNYHLEYAVLSQRGYYPDSPDKQNQDSFCIKTQVQDNPNVHFFGVFDGHGQFGAECSHFVADRLVNILSNDSTLLDNPAKGFMSAYDSVNTDLHNSSIDDSMSGTTAISILFVGDKVFVANAGDSRAVISVQEGSKIIAEDLSEDQTPFRRDEYDRVKVCGARVLSVDQVEGLKDPNVQTWGDEETEGGDPPRLWVPNGMYPGTAFTRSIGDSIAEKIGVVPDPEVSVVRLTPDHLFLVVASDGIFEFLSSQLVVNMVAKYADPRDACSAISGEAYKLWLEHENRTDDITIIIIHIKDLPRRSFDVSEESSRPFTVRTRRDVPELYTVPGTDFYRSVRSNFSDMQPFPLIDRSQAVIFPSPAHPGPAEVVNGNG